MVTGGYRSFLRALAACAVAWPLMGMECGKLMCREDADCYRLSDEDHMNLCVVHTGLSYEPSLCVETGIVLCEAQDDCLPPYVCFDGTCGLGSWCPCFDGSCVDEVCAPQGLVCEGQCVRPSEEGAP